MNAFTPSTSRMRALPPDHEPSAWLRETLVEVLDGVRADRIRPCGHLRRGNVGTVPLWRRENALCTSCLPRMLLPHGSAQDRCCDRCGAVADGVYPALTFAAPTLLVVFGLCPACYRMEVGR